MNIGILLFKTPSTDTDSNTSRVEKAAIERGHTCIRILEPDLTFFHDENGLKILHQGEPLPDLDIIIMKANFIEEPSLRTYAVQLLSEAGYKIINKGPGFAWAKNKLTQHVAFTEHNLPCPKWAIARKSDEALKLAEDIGFPSIIKVAFGTHGKGVFYAENKETFKPISDYLAVRDRNPLIIEEFIEEANRRDIRVFVLGGKIIGSMQREAPAGDMRANTSNGGIGHEVTLTEEEKAIALKAAEVYQLEMAGVDLIRSNRGPLVLEVNSNPGFKELERVTQKDIAGAIIDYAVSQA